MVTVTLPENFTKNESGWREKLFPNGQRITPSIRFQTESNENISSTVHTLNSEEAVKYAKDAANRKEILKTHGIAVAKDKTTILREYIVYVFQTEVLAVYRSMERGVWFQDPASKRKKKRYNKVPIKTKNRELRHIQTLAIRSLYALGLDYGVVICGVGVGKKYLFLNMSPQPMLPQEQMVQYQEVIDQYLDQIRRKVVPEEFQLGADPEFVMVNYKNQLILASNYFSYYGKVGCDAIWTGQNRADKPLVELRPDPAIQPRELVKNIYQCMQIAAKRMRGVSCKWLAGALPYKGFPIGGHIHFSGIDVNFKLLRALDNYLTLPLTCAEDPKGISRRPKYGFLGDYRFPSHGGFEYRTPPSWLVSPTLTKGVFALAKLIAIEYSKLRSEPFQKVAIQKAYYSGNKSPLRKLVRSLQEELMQTETYEIYQKDLDAFFNYINSGKTWNENVDFRRVWRISPYQKRSKT